MKGNPRLSWTALGCVAILCGSPALSQENHPGAAPDREWQGLEEKMAAVKGAMAKPGEGLRAALAAYDDAARDFVTKHPGDARRWALRFFDGVTLESRQRAGLPVQGDQIAIMNEILQASGVDEETRSGASAVRVLAAHRDLEKGGDRIAWVHMAEQHLKEFPVHPANQRIRASLEQVKTLLAFKDKLLDLKFTATDGRVVDVSALRGKVVLVDFWASYCELCNEDMPGIVSVYEKLHPKGFEIIGICVDKQEMEMKKFIEANQMTWPQYFDGREWDGALVNRLGVHFTPTMWLLDKTGHIVFTDVRGRLEPLAEGLLEKP
jgi:peroxiredoxin